MCLASAASKGESRWIGGADSDRVRDRRVALPGQLRVLLPDEFQRPFFGFAQELAQFHGASRAPPERLAVLVEHGAERRVFERHTLGPARLAGGVEELGEVLGLGGAD